MVFKSVYKSWIKLVRVFCSVILNQLHANSTFQTTLPTTWQSVVSPYTKEPINASTSTNVPVFIYTITSPAMVQLLHPLYYKHIQPTISVFTLTKSYNSWKLMSVLLSFPLGNLTIINLFDINFFFSTALCLFLCDTWLYTMSLQHFFLLVNNILLPWYCLLHMLAVPFPLTHVHKCQMSENTCGCYWICLV